MADNITLIESFTLSDLWFDVMSKACDRENTKIYLTEKGSFENEMERRQFNGLAMCVSHPETRPLAPYVEGLGIEPPTTNDYIEQYFSEYLMSPNKAANEEYSYGEFIYPSLKWIIDLLKRTPNTNHAVINIGESLKYGTITMDDCSLPEPKLYENPPCLRCLTWQYDNGKLDVGSFWRSWDLFAGMPTNLGGIQLLNEYIALECGYETGKMYAYSTGAHIYLNKETISTINQRTKKQLV